MSYFGNIKRGIKTTAKGMSLTLKHFTDARFSRAEKQIADADFFELDRGHVTIQYPHQTIEVPDHGRYQLDCEIDDCIVCDKCAKICPVDCIEIEAIKSPELIRTASDGSPVRLHAAKFDIDMAKCCFCGLCTTVCPTECLTMNSEYDYSVVDITQLNFAFSNLSEAEAQEKRELYDQFVAEKEALKAEQQKSLISEETEPKKPVARLVFMPSQKAKPAVESGFSPTTKPAFRPTIKPRGVALTNDKPSEKSVEEAAAIKKPAFVPSKKPVENKESTSFVPKKPVFKPTLKPKTEDTDTTPVAKLPFKPTMKPKKD